MEDPELVQQDPVLLNEQELEQQLIDFTAEHRAVVESSIADILSASDELCAYFDAIIANTPVHPYERLMKEYISPDCQMLSLSDVTCPEDFCLSSVAAEITAIAVKYSDLFELHTQALSTDKMEEVYTAFAMPSGENFIVDSAKVTNHLQFVNMVNSIPLELVDADPVMVAKKLLTQYIKTY
jgi:hypothetical protein